MNQKLTEIQKAYIECLGPMLPLLAGGLESLSKPIGVSAGDLAGFLDYKHGLTDSQFSMLTMLTDAKYEFLEWDQEVHGFDDHAHAWTGLADYTLFPKNRKQLEEAWLVGSGGGDTQDFFEIVPYASYFFREHRILFINRGVTYCLIVVPIEAEYLDQLIESKELLNYQGSRLACSELSEAILNHLVDLKNDPDNRREYEQKFYMNKEMVFAQLSITPFDDNY